jgi:eukaryotic-like serine/threonine-protein kinase
MIGQTVSHYQILEKLGEGGMGVVYKARDAKLDRLVALKFLPEHVAESPGDLERFIQEARAAAGLSHPNICTIHGIEEHEGKSFIVMEFVDGQTLQEKKSSLSTKQALDIGVQIAEGLAAAHEKGIVHRDIKPENIMIRKDGRVQVMDFGLAKLRGVSRLTKEGSTVGTAGYMSPEQVQGHEADHRSDIFSLGVLLYEMLTGQPPFKGVHETAIAYEIVNVDSPPMSSVKPDILPELDAIVLQCLEKDPNERIQAAKQVAVDLRRHTRESVGKRAVGVSGSRRTSVSLLPSADRGGGSERTRSHREILLLSGGTVALLLAVVFAFLYFSESKAELSVIRSYIHPPDGTVFATQVGLNPGGHLAIAPDGRSLVFAAADTLGQVRLWVRQLRWLEAWPLEGTEGGTYPFWSPDGRSIAFFADGKLKRVNLAGGPPSVLCDAPAGRGGSWNAGGTIVFAPQWGSPLYAVSAEGGTPRSVTMLDTTSLDRNHRWPHFLPDGNRFLYVYQQDPGGTDIEPNGAYAGLLDGSIDKFLTRTSSQVVYASGYLIFVREGILLAQAFDTEKLELQGEAIALAEWIQGNVMFSRSAFDVSPAGVLVYQVGDQPSGQQLFLFDRHGNRVTSVGTPSLFISAQFSPDGKKIAYDPFDSQAKNRDIWILDIERSSRRRLTFDESTELGPIWSPDGEQIAFHSGRRDTNHLCLIGTAGSGKVESFWQSGSSIQPDVWSADGKWMTVIVSSQNQDHDVYLVSPTGRREPLPFLRTKFD